MTFVSESMAEEAAPRETNQALGVKSISEKRTFTATVTDYDPQECGGFRIVAAVASFVLKGEDRYTFVTSSSEPQLEKSQSPDSPAKLVAFAGVFDGHDGERASQYCSKGMLHHILAETGRLSHKMNPSKSGRKRSNSTNHHSFNSQLSSNSNSNNKDINIQVLKQGHVNGFTWAQTRFGTGAEPPTFKEVQDGTSQVRCNQSFLQKIFCGPTRYVRGGTTATCISLYSKMEESQHRDSTRPVLCALVSCTGDSRCITDDGGGYGHDFRSVTKDHRPGEPEENRRLQKCVKRGVTLMEKDDNVFGTLRIYPGGLAVSRTVGDLGLTEAAVPTPEVFTVSLSGGSHDTTDDGSATFRFVIASDGLWDVFDTEEVGKIVARLHSDEDGSVTVKSPKDAAKELLDACIKQGGYEDDVTLLIMDVSVL